MIKIKNVDEEQYKLITKIPFNEGSESNTYIFNQNGQQKVFKLFKYKDCIDNKVKKIILMNDRLKKCDFVVKADYIVETNNKIVGYVMPWSNGTHLYNFSKEEKINILKEVSKKLKILHALDIVSADFYGNILVDSKRNIKFIDYDNFSIDNIPVDAKNYCLEQYEKHIKKFDKRFDDYLLNMYTISLATNYCTGSLYDRYKDKIYIFNFKDEEINKIVKNTMELKNFYNEDLIIDKINSKKDLKKIKRKIF